MEKYNKSLSQQEARNAIRDGINLAADLVAPTLGHSSRRVVIDAEFGSPDISDDGTTILNKLDPEDTSIGLGVKVAQDSSAKTNTDAGDGTTTTAVILRELVNQLLKEDSKEELLFKKTSGNNAKLSKEIKSGLSKVIDYIDEHKIDINSKEQVVQVAKISSNSEEIGQILGDMYDKLGNDGVITVSEGNSVDTTYEVVSGMSFDQGWLAPQFVTDAQREEAILENARVLVYSGKISDVPQIKKVVEIFQAYKINDLLIIADDVTGIPLNTLVANKMAQVIRTCAVKAPQLGNAEDLLLDICAVTGATIIGGKDGIQFDDIKPEHIGSAERVVVSKNKTIIVGVDSQKAVDDRVSTLENRLENEKSEYEKSNLRTRIAKLRGGVGTIKVGGQTPLEIKDRKAKITDAVSAVKSALSSGIVAGGGVALLNASQVLSDEGGEAILKKAIRKPYEQILENSDADVDTLKEKSLATGHGYNADTEEFGDMVALGVVDPAGVVKSAVSNAVSDALMVASIGGSIVLIREKKNKENVESY